MANRKQRIVTPMQMREQLDLEGLNYSHCLSSKCSHFDAMVSGGPRYRDCPAGHLVRRRIGRIGNTFTTGAIDNVIRQLYGSAAPFSLQILVAGMGTSTALTTDAQTILTAEVDRIAINSTLLLGQVGVFYKQVQTSFFIDNNHGNANLQEFGLFAGGATLTANTGFMVTRALYPWGNKTIADTISGIWTITGAG